VDASAVPVIGLGIVLIFDTRCNCTVFDIERSDHPQPRSYFCSGLRSLLGVWACWPISRSLAIPDTLVLPTVPADTARHVRGVGAVLEVIGGLSSGRPRARQTTLRRS
jgi:hypothetical protein